MCRKTSLCETDSPDTGEVALVPEGERCPEGAEGAPSQMDQGVNAPFLTVCASAVAYLCLLFYTPGVRHRKWQNEKGF